MEVENYTINSDLTVDVKGDVELIALKLSYLPVQFGLVGGYFDCDVNYLTSLEGAPKKVGGYFDCSNNNLTSLEGAPKELKGNFFCNNNNLTTLEGAPKRVEGNFYCGNNTTQFTEEDVKAVSEVKGDIVVLKQ